MKMIKQINRHLRVFSVLLLAASMVACEVDDGKIQNTIELPPPGDSTLNFACADEGIFEEDCVLDNSENPYASVAIKGELNDDDDPLDPNFKFNLSDAAPSEKARYYVWASALAKGAGASGENQFFVAEALRKVFGESGSDTTQKQARKAYRSVLDNYFLSASFFPATANGEEVFLPFLLKDVVGQNLFEPTDDSLYSDPNSALVDLAEWGYVYDQVNKTISVFE